VLFPPVLLLFFLGGIAVPVGAAAFLLLSPNCGWFFVTVAVGYFLSYEWLHFSYHLPEDHWLARTRVVSALRRHHTLHHDVAKMGKWNFNITFPITDAVMGTSFKK
jgi:sterol desaturase/sphingolipid hydroxylase (fatty acid hydroxylase superfamily)